MDKITIHPSGVGGFFECQYKWFRDNLYQPKRMVSYKATLGTGIHKGAELQYRESIKAGKFVSFKKEFEEASIECFRESLKTNDISDIKEFNQDEVEKTLKKASQTYGNDLSNLNDLKLPVDVEKSYFLPIRSRLVSGISGTLDIVGSDYIVDIKTMSKNKSTSSYAVQQGIYALLRQHQGEEVNNLLIDKIVLSKNVICKREAILEEEFKPVKYIIAHSKTLLNALLNRVELFAQTGNESLFVGNPNSWLCNKKYCPYFDECKYHL